MRNIRLIIEYDGTNYHGWQIQNNAVTVQGTIETAINKLTGETVKLTGASRTDVGVHAFFQVANFNTCSTIPPDKFCYALNRLLPNDIIIKSSEEVGIEFHSRYSAKFKRYRYIIYNSPFPSPLQRNRVYHVPQVLDFDNMEKAIYFFLGKHDFASFQSTGSAAKTSVRTIKNVLIKEDIHTITIEVVGDGFLYNMVRIMAGTLVEVGLGKITAESLPDIINSLDRRKAGKTAPAHALYLLEVLY